MKGWLKRLSCLLTNHHNWADTKTFYVVMSGRTVASETCNLCGAVMDNHLQRYTKRGRGHENVPYRSYPSS